MATIHRVSYLKRKILFGYNFFSDGRRDLVLRSKCSSEQWLCPDRSFIRIHRTQPERRRVDWDHPPKPPPRFSEEDFRGPWLFSCRRKSPIRRPVGSSEPESTTNEISWEPIENSWNAKALNEQTTRLDFDWYSTLPFFFCENNFFHQLDYEISFAQSSPIEEGGSWVHQKKLRPDEIFLGGRRWGNLRWKVSFNPSAFQLCLMGSYDTSMSSNLFFGASFWAKTELSTTTRGKVLWWKKVLI